MSAYDYLTNNMAAMDPNDNVGKVRKPGGGRRGAGALNPHNPTAAAAGSPVRGNQHPIGELMQPGLVELIPLQYE